MSDFLVVGESLVDIVIPAKGARHDAVGGSCLNVAVGLARLDVPTTLVTRVGDDVLGRLVVNHVRASDAGIAPGSIVPGARTSTATARLDEQHAASYEFDLVWDLPPQVLPDDVLGVHVGSLGAALSPGRSSVVALARAAAESDAFVSYDPNIRPAFLDDVDAAWAEVRELAALSRLVKLSDEDLRLLRPDEPEDDVLRTLLAGEATELVLLTRGAEGARVVNDSGSFDVPAPRIDVVDTVGAGDSFMAATLALLSDWDVLSGGEGGLAALDDDRVQLLARGAMTAAAVTCSRRGANPPSRAELPSTWPA